MLSALNYSDDGGALVGAFRSFFLLESFKKRLKVSNPPKSSQLKK
jgi:hypothetical protein